MLYIIVTNFISYKNTLNYFLSSNWFHCLNNSGDSNRNLHIIKDNKKYNFIDNKGNIISNDWFVACDNFFNGFALVALDNTYNIIDVTGKKLVDDDIIYVRVFYYRKVYVVYMLYRKKDKKRNFVYNGKIVSNVWLDWADSFTTDNDGKPHSTRVLINDEKYRLQIHGALHHIGPNNCW